MDSEPTSGVAWSAERERSHVERFCPVLYFVAAPVITHIRIHQLYGGWVEGGEESGGGSFVQHSVDPPAEIITELLESPAELVANGLSEAESLRPGARNAESALPALVRSAGSPRGPPTSKFTRGDKRVHASRLKLA